MTARPILSETDLDRLAELSPTLQQAADRLTEGFAALAAALPSAEDAERFCAKLNATDLRTES